MRIYTKLYYSLRRSDKLKFNVHNTIASIVSENILQKYFKDPHRANENSYEDISENLLQFCKLIRLSLRSNDKMKAVEEEKSSTLVAYFQNVVALRNSISSLDHILFNIANGEVSSSDLSQM